MRLIDADRLLDKCKFYHLPNGDLAIPIIDVQRAPTIELPNINVGNMGTISRQQAIDEIHEDAEWLASQGSDWQTERMERDKSILESLPSAQPEQRWIPVTEESVIQAGYEGKEVRFRIRGRLFAIRELAQ